MSTDLAQLLDELRRTAGAEPRVDSFSVAREPCALRVSVSHDSHGAVSTLALRFDYDDPARIAAVRGAGGEALVAIRPLEILLRRETAEDRAAKADGTNGEWQTGDAAFDGVVYVSTPNDDARALAAVSRAEVRSAALDLFAMGFEQITIDGGDSIGKGAVEARRSREARDTPRAATAELVLAAMEQLARYLPVVTHSGTARAAPPLTWLTRSLAIVGAAGWLLSVAWVGLLARIVDAIRPGSHDGSSVAPAMTLVVLAFSVAAGVLGGWRYGELLRARLRGSSQARERLGRARIAGFLGFSVLAAFVGALAVLFLRA